MQIFDGRGVDAPNTCIFQEWTVYPLLIYKIWNDKFSTLQRFLKQININDIHIVRYNWYYYYTLTVVLTFNIY